MIGFYVNGTVYFIEEGKTLPQKVRKEVKQIRDSLTEMLEQRYILEESMYVVGNSIRPIKIVDVKNKEEKCGYKTVCVLYEDEDVDIKKLAEKICKSLNKKNG